MGIIQGRGNPRKCHRTMPPSLWQALGAAVAEGLAEGSGTAANPSRQAGGSRLSLNSIAGSLASVVGDAIERRVQQATLAHADGEDVALAVLMLRLAEYAYLNERAQVDARLRGEGFQLIHFNKASFLPQWFIARGSLARQGGPANAFFCAFRGTDSQADVVRDLMVSAVEHHGIRFHEGFLSGVLSDEVLAAQLAATVGAERSTPLYLIGHSLGGSLAATVPCAGLLPQSFAGPVHVFQFGSPPGLLGMPPPGQLAPAAARARILCFVNDADAVPRLLGSPLPLVARTLLKTTSSRPGGTRHSDRAGPGVDELLELLPRFMHLEHAEVVLLRGGSAFQVGLAERPAVLHLHEALRLNVMADHGIENYRRALEAAIRGGLR